MAFNGNQITTFKDGTTPATGTIAFGSTFNNEFNRLYANWNTFFNAAGNQFSIDRINVDNIYSIDGDGVNFGDVFGYNIDAPVAELHLNKGDSTSCLLHITNSTTGATINNGLSIGLDSSENGIINLKENKDLYFYTNNQLRMTIDSSGNVGIGTTDIEAWSSVVKAIHLGPDAVIIAGETTGWGIHTVLNAYFDTAWKYRTTDEASSYFQYNGEHVWRVASSGTIDTAISWTEVMTINNAGNVGIGISNPSNRLHILSTTTPQFRIAYDSNSYATLSVADGGDLTIACGEATGRINLTPGASDALVYITGAGQTTGNMTIGGTLSLTGNMITDLVISDTTESTSKDTGCLVLDGGIGIEKNLSIGGDIQDGSGNTVIVFNSSQDVAIGTLNSPLYRLDVQDNADTSYVARFYNDGNNANRYGIRVQCGADNGVGQTYYFTAADGNNTLVGYLEQTAGAVFQLVDVSDERLKSKIENTKINATDIIMRFNLKEYFKNNSKDKTRIGFIAQNVKEVYPEASSVYDNNGKEFYGVAKENLIPLLTKMNQEQQEVINDLKEELNNIKKIINKN